MSGRNLHRAPNWAVTAKGHRFHDLRHTAATRWIASGLDVKTVSVWLGHSDSAITHRTYAGYLGATADSAAIALLERIATAAAAAPPSRARTDTMPLR